MDKAGITISTDSLDSSLSLLISPATSQPSDNNQPVFLLIPFNTKLAPTLLTPR